MGSGSSSLGLTGLEQAQLQMIAERRAEKAEEIIKTKAEEAERVAAFEEKQAGDRTLSKYVIFQSDVNNLYLHFDRKNPDIPNALRYAGDYSFGLETRYEVVPHTKDTRLIHIRCLRNNKYWSIFEGHGTKWVTAMADKPKEEESDKQCTLFQPVYVHSSNKRVLKLQHVNTGHYVRLFHGSGHRDGCLYLHPKLEDVETCTFIDWESVVMLPDLIRIKGENGNHLKANGGDGYMDYNNKADNSSLFDFEAFPSRDGGIRLRSTYYNTYWTDMDDSYWVLLKKASTTDHETNTVFLPTIVGGNRILMRCLKNGYFCKRFSDHKKTSCLATLANYPDDWSYMEFEEPIISRRIDNVRYHEGDARIYNEISVALITDDTSNKTEGPVTSELNLTTKVTNTTSWTNSVGLTEGTKMSFTAGVQYIGQYDFAISAEASKSRSWGDTKEEDEEVGTVESVTVEPGTRVKASLMATRFSYDIPFSYTQHDILMDTTTKTTEKVDGLCTGRNGYRYDHGVDQLPLE